MFRSQNAIRRFGRLRQELEKGTQQLHQIPGWLQLLTTNAAPEKLLLLYPRSQTQPQIQEALQLAETFTGQKCSSQAAGSSKRFVHHPASFFGTGAIQEVATVCESSGFQRVFVNAQLSGVQLRNLEAAWKLPVVDRVGLIIEIFAQRARTREARLQVEMAALQYKATRLVRTVDSKSGARKGFGTGWQTEVVSARQRGRSGGASGGLGGASGGGETELQLQRRRIQNRIKALQRKLEEVRRTREVHRRRRRRAGNPLVGIVGYTSAGKSSLLTALSQKWLSAEERLFETLDPAWASVYLPSGQAALVSDTVGFISDLPPSLVSAFQATLEEVAEADILLHVLDANSSNVAEQRKTVYEVLRRLQISESRLQDKLIEVWNKSDLVMPSSPAADASFSASEDDTGQMRASGLVEAPAESSQSTIDEGSSPVVTVGSLASPDASAHKLNHTVSEHGSGQLPQSKSGASSEKVEEAEVASARALRAALQDESAGGAGDQVLERSDEEPLKHWNDDPGEREGDEISELLKESASTSSALAKDENVLDAEFESRQQDAVWKLIQEIREEQGSLQPRAVVTSTITRQGLPTLLEEIDKMVSLKCAIEELKFNCFRLGPRALSENVVGPPVKSSENRRALNRRLPRVQPDSDDYVRRRAIWQS